MWIKKAVVGAFTNVTQQFVLLSSQLIIAPLIILYAGTSALGGYAVLLQVIAYTSAFDFGVSVIITRLLSQNYQKKHEFYQIYLVANRIFFYTHITAAGFLLICALNVNWITTGNQNVIKQLETALLILSFWYIVRYKLVLHTTNMTSAQKFVELNIINLVVGIIKLLLSVAFVFFNLEILGLVYAIVLSELTALVIKRKFRPIKFGNWDDQAGGTEKHQAFKDIFKNGFTHWGVQLSTLLFVGTDNLLIGKIYGLAPLAIYYPNKMIMSYIFLTFSQAFSFLIPGLTLKVSQGNIYEIRPIYINCVRYVSFFQIYTLSMVLIYSEQLFGVWIGSNFYYGLELTASLIFLNVALVAIHFYAVWSVAIGNPKKWGVLSIICGTAGVFIAYTASSKFDFFCIPLIMGMSSLPVIFYLRNFVISFLDRPNIDWIDLTKYGLILICIIFVSYKLTEFILNYFKLSDLTLLLLSLTFSNMLAAIGIWKYILRPGEREFISIRTAIFLDKIGVLGRLSK